MNNANRDYFEGLALKFHRAHAQAIARVKEGRTKEKQQQSSVQNVISDDSGTVITTSIIKSTSTYKAITSLDSDEQYRTTIISKMIAHIKQKKESAQ